MRYVACGNVMLDRVEDRNGEPGPINLGGPALFALSGMRIWTEQCKIACRAGADFGAYFGNWMDRHNIVRDSVDIETEHNILHILKRRDQSAVHWQAVYGEEHKGYLRVTPELIDRATDYETMGIWIAQNEDKVFWQKLYDVKTRKGFKVLWENEPPLRDEKPAQHLQRIKDVLPMADLWTVTLPEASRLFGIPQRNEDDLIAEIMKLPVELTLLRMGSNGSWAVTPSAAAHCDSLDVDETVDPLGCGSTAAGAALVAHCEGYNAARVAVMANVAAGFTAAQMGVMDPITAERMQRAQQLADVQYKRVTAKRK